MLLVDNFKLELAGHPVMLLGKTISEVLRKQDDSELDVTLALFEAVVPVVASSLNCSGRFLLSLTFFLQFFKTN